MACFCQHSDLAGHVIDIQPIQGLFSGNDLSTADLELCGECIGYRKPDTHLADILVHTCYRGEIAQIADAAD